MTLTEIQPAATPSPPPYHGAKAVAVFFIFVIVGPPLGFLTLLVIGGILSPSQFSLPLRINPDQFHMVFHGMIIFGAISYIFGGIQAATVGLVAAISRYLSRKQRIPLSTIVITSAAVGIVFLAIIILRPRQPWQQSPAGLGVMAGWMAIHLGAGIGCWALANLTLRPTKPLSSVGA